MASLDDIHALGRLPPDDAGRQPSVPTDSDGKGHPLLYSADGEVLSRVPSAPTDADGEIPLRSKLATILEGLDALPTETADVPLQDPQRVAAALLDGEGSEVDVARLLAQVLDGVAEIPTEQGGIRELTAVKHFSDRSGTGTGKKKLTSGVIDYDLGIEYIQPLALHVHYKQETLAGAPVESSVKIVGGHAFDGSTGKGGSDSTYGTEARDTATINCTLDAPLMFGRGPADLWSTDARAGGRGEDSEWRVYDIQVILVYRNLAEIL